jgi:hypothetical protein
MERLQNSTIRSHHHFRRFVISHEPFRQDFESQKPLLPKQETVMGWMQNLFRVDFRQPNEQPLCR